MKKWLLASAVAAVGMSSAANAAIVVTVTPAAVNPPQSSTGTMTGYTGFVVSLNNSVGNGAGGTGLPITGVDIFNAGGGFSGPIQQRWTFDVDTEVFVPTPTGTATGANATTAANLDSHILIPEADRQGGNPPSENNNVSPGFQADTASADFGTGSFLKVAGGITGPSSQVIVPLAYIIIKNDATVALLGSATEQGNGTPFPIAATIAVPEPTSLGLLGLGAVGLLARRRRQI